MAASSRQALPGFVPSLGFTISYLAILLLIPIAACGAKALSLSWSQFWAVVWTERAQAAYALTFGASLVAALVNSLLGVLIAWVIVRYDFPFKRVLDAAIDLPLALPTAVAGLVYASLYVRTGWYGQFLVPIGIEAAHTRLAVVLVLVFVGLPFVVRTVQPVLESQETELEEAAASLGASRWQTFRRVLLPALAPGVLTGFALAFARGLGEYGSVVFVSGNLPLKTEIAPVLIVAKLEEHAVAQANAIALVLLIGSLATLGLVNWLERRSRRHAA